MTIKEAQKAVADYFLDIMKEEQFDTFQEMKQCYWWTSKDVKDEVKAVLDADTDCYVDEVDGKDVLNDTEMVPYRQFMNGVYHIINTLRA